MNAYKLNGIASHVTRQAIADGLQIMPSEIYKKVKSISTDGIIVTDDSKKFKIVLIELVNE